MLRRALGKGLAELLGESEAGNLREVAIDSIVPNPRQPRRKFDDLSELSESIGRVGLMQPLVVRLLDKDRFELIAGERRWRAAKQAGLATVPIIIRSADSTESLVLALIENVQREDISALDAAEAYCALSDVHGLTQEEIARRVGKSRSAIANTMRLSKLPSLIRESLATGQITEGHARALLQFETEAEQLLAHQRILDKGLTVRDTERLTNRTKSKSKPTARRTPQPIETALSEFFGAPVTVERGQIRIEYFSDEDLERILERLGIDID